MMCELGMAQHDDEKEYMELDQSKEGKVEQQLYDCYSDRERGTWNRSITACCPTLRLLATRVFQMHNPRCHFLILCIQLISIISFYHYVIPIRGEDNNTSAVKVDVGIILDLETDVGKVMHISILLALEDYHANASHGATRIVPHIKDSTKDDVEATSAAIYLLKDVQVQAIFGPQMSTQTDFVIDLGNRTKVPIISPATSPLLTVKENPFFIRAALVKNFDWREVVVIYEDSPYGFGIVPHLTDALLEISSLVSYRSVLSPSANDDQILKELYNLNTKQTRVFVVHLRPYLASRLFLKAKEAGMMSSGYAWIMTDVLTSLLDLVDHSVIESSMQGVLGIKPYIPRSNQLNNYTKRWRKRFRQEYPDMDQIELNTFGLWAYDGITLSAEAVGKLGTTAIPKLKKLDTRENLTDLDALGTSEVGSQLIDSMRNTVLKQGLSGDYRIINRELQPFPYQIVNIIGKGEKSIGFWTEKDDISCKLKNGKTAAKCNNKKLGAIFWPGESTIVPRGWEMPTSGKKLRVGVPLKGGLEQLIKVERDSKTQAVTATGFCADVFKEVILSLPYALPYEFIPFPIQDPLTLPDYDDLVHKITSQDYDAVVGDVTILASRSEYVDFTLPFIESGESVTSNLTRFVLIVWVFVVLVLTSSYTASLTSMLTLQQLQPTITGLNDLIKNGEYVGYQEGSFVKDVFIKRMKFDSSKFRSYITLEDYDDALSRGSKNGGVGAIVDELPYLRLFLNKYCRKYIMVGRTYKAAGYGFAFPKGSPLVPDVSRAVLKVMEGEFMNNIIQKWFGNETDCPQKDETAITSDSLTLDNFKGLFLIAGVSAGSALLLFFLNFLNQNREILATDDSICQKLTAIAKVFDEEKVNSNSMSEKPSERNGSNASKLLAAREASPEILPDLPLQIPEIRISDGLGESPAAEGFSTTEPRTPVHETITDTIEER
ncbi:hypothetical protein H5410_033254 [Solanum commersonii]|uniref:Glutamate receptor n=1 Tax=Solanum commersonii TaxID=4109 RepID=A0A9J5YS13_SOLCO|nr:hypothetical protein H5410_033254 [Solanum commersonii]